MKWVKQGNIYNPDQFVTSWRYSHGTLPFVTMMKGDSIRVFYTARNKERQSLGSWVDISLASYSVLASADKPLIEPGKLGCFDDAGAWPSSVVEHEGRIYLYYLGWRLTVATGFGVFIGLALSDDAGSTFHRYSPAPILGPSLHDPYLTSSPWVLIENGLWRMWYLSGVGWEKRSDATVRHYYHIKYAESKDGIAWQSTNTVCIDFRSGIDEYALARPVVRKVGNKYTMWYCYRAGAATYRPGYAESDDGIVWERKDELVGIDVSEHGWDAQMFCYPFVFEHLQKTYMLYAGNEYGKTGFGLAYKEE